jgi:hypothetical protein
MSNRILAGGWRKNPHLAFLYRRRGAAGGLRAESRLGGGVEGDPQLQPDGAAGRVGLVIVSYLIYGCYDLLGRAYCGHKLAKRQVMLVSFICYAFNLTLSTWVGGIGMRYRLYSRLGLPGGTITRIFP